MDRRTICRRLHSIYGKGFVNISQVAEFLGVGRETASKMLKDLDFLRIGKGNAKSYLIDDVADMILRNRG